MAWLKCNMGSVRIPVPTGVTYTNALEIGASINRTNEWHNKSETINTQSASQIKVRVDYSFGIYASGDGTYARDETSFVFKVNGTTYLNESKDDVSNNDGWVNNSYSATYTITNLPAGNCVFDYNFCFVDTYQNSGALSFGAKASIAFTITEVTYRE